MDSESDQQHEVLAPMLCYSPLCQYPPYVCYCCEECEESHEHEGHTNFIRLDVLQKQIKESMVIDSPADCEEEISKALDDLAAKSKEISSTVT